MEKMKNEENVIKSLIMKEILQLITAQTELSVMSVSMS